MVVTILDKEGKAKKLDFTVVDEFISKLEKILSDYDAIKNREHQKIFVDYIDEFNKLEKSQLLNLFIKDYGLLVQKTDILNYAVENSKEFANFTDFYQQIKGL